MAKLSKSKLKKKCWELMSKVMRLEHPSCQICGKPSSDAHHIIPRARGNSVYFLKENIIVICKSCHMGWHNRWSPEECREATIKAIGQENYDFIEEQKKQYLKYSYSDLEDLRKELENQLRGL